MKQVIQKFVSMSWIMTMIILTAPYFENLMKQDFLLGIFLTGAFLFSLSKCLLWLNQEGDMIHANISVNDVPCTETVNKQDNEFMFMTGNHKK